MGTAQLAEVTTHSGVVLRRFSAVNIIDSTQVSLPERCQERFGGSGGLASAASAKIQVNYEYLSGMFTGLSIGSGRVSDQRCIFPVDVAKHNSLTLFDLGDFKLATLKAISAVGGWFITRLHLFSWRIETNGVLSPLCRWLRFGRLKA